MMGLGFQQKMVYIEEIADGFAHCIDGFGKTEVVPVIVMRAKGSTPQVGESWIIDRAMGDWTFAAVTNHQTPEITGSRGSGAALKKLLSTLVELGIIVDKTTT